VPPACRITHLPALRTAGFTFCTWDLRCLPATAPATARGLDFAPTRCPTPHRTPTCCQFLPFAYAYALPFFPTFLPAVLPAWTVLLLHHLVHLTPVYLPPRYRAPGYYRLPAATCTGLPAPAAVAVLPLHRRDMPAFAALPPPTHHRTVLDSYLQVTYHRYRCTTRSTCRAHYYPHFTTVCADYPTWDYHTAFAATLLSLHCHHAYLHACLRCRLLPYAATIHARALHCRAFATVTAGSHAPTFALRDYWLRLPRFTPHFILPHLPPLRYHYTYPRGPAPATTYPHTRYTARVAATASGLLYATALSRFTATGDTVYTPLPTPTAPPAPCGYRCAPLPRYHTFCHSAPTPVRRAAPPCTPRRALLTYFTPRRYHRAACARGYGFCAHCAPLAIAPFATPCARCLLTPFHTRAAVAAHTCRAHASPHAHLSFAVLPARTRTVAAPRAGSSATRAPYALPLLGLPTGCPPHWCPAVRHTYLPTTTFHMYSTTYT